jgi:bifunctional DNase/RNase
MGTEYNGLGRVPSALGAPRPRSTFASPQELFKEHDMPVAMELSRIIISEINSEQVIYLREIDGTRTFPILIGIFEATSIDRRVKGFETPRPLTHDLLVNTVEALGGELQDVVVSELKDHVYYAVLRIRREGELLEIDARPSDAIAVAVTCSPQLPIYVSEDVLRDVSP